MRISFLLLLLTAQIGCSPVQVKSSKLTPEAKNNAYKTYNFYDLKVQDPQPERTLPQVRQERFNMLKNAISRELEQVGLEKSPQPDLWVNIGVLVEDKVQTRETTIRDAPLYMGQRNYHWESQEIVVDEYRKGTVTIDLIDAATNQMVGQSVASGVIVEDNEKLQKRIDQGMAKAFNDLWSASD